MTDEVFESPMAKAVYVAGGQSSLAKKVGVTQGAVWKWVRGSRKFLLSMQWQSQTQLMELLSLMNCVLICRLFSRTRAMRCDMSRHYCVSEPLLVAEFSNENELAGVA